MNLPQYNTIQYSFISDKDRYALMTKHRKCYFSTRLYSDAFCEEAAGQIRSKFPQHQYRNNEKILLYDSLDTAQHFFKVPIYNKFQ